TLTSFVVYCDSTIHLISHQSLLFCLLFFFLPPPTTDIYTLSLHDALPIYHRRLQGRDPGQCRGAGLCDSRLDLRAGRDRCHSRGDRKSTRLNSSHLGISYAVFCLKKKKKKTLIIAKINKNNHTHI